MDMYPGNSKDMSVMDMLVQLVLVVVWKRPHSKGCCRGYDAWKEMISVAPKMEARTR